MLNIPTPPPRQVLLRLPDDLAAKLARAVPSRQRNRYIIELLTHDLAAKEEANGRLLAEAAERLNEIEAQYPELARETEEWVNAVLTEDDDDGFDKEVFEREFAIAQADMAKRTSR